MNEELQPATKWRTFDERMPEHGHPIELRWDGREAPLVVTFWPHIADACESIVGAQWRQIQ